MTQDETIPEITLEEIKVLHQKGDFKKGLEAGIRKAQYDNGYNMGYHTTMHRNENTKSTYTQAEIDEIKTIAYKRGFLDGVNPDILADMDIIPDIKRVGENEIYGKGYEQGHEDGYDVGYNEGYEEGQDDKNER